MTWQVIRPIGANVLVKLHEKRTHYGMLEMPDDWRKQQETAEVISVGPRAPSELQPGQTVYTGKFNGRSIESPDHDPHSEYRMLDCDYQKPKPFVPDLYAILDHDSATELLRVGTDVPKALCK